MNLRDRFHFFLNFLRYLKHNPKMLKRFILISKERGFFRAIKEAVDHLGRMGIINYLPKPILIRDKRSSHILDFNNPSSPEITIIINSSGDIKLTYSSLKAILKHTNIREIEVFVSGKFPAEEVNRLKALIRGVRFIRGTSPEELENLARGKYLVFLDDHVQVQPQWLEELLRTVKSQSKAGIVGPKVIYPNGRLGEAGGIVWRDGSSCGYGKRDNPEKPEYNYLKEVDYVSEVCFLIRRELWSEIGGLDETYNSDHYKILDLAFKVRERGYVVIYQPRSVVAYLGSLKREDQEGKDTFLSKWGKVLERNHLPRGRHILLARDRSVNREHVLIIDRCVPRFDQDAGSKTIFQWIKIFRDLGMQITFIGDDLLRQEPYTSILQDMGVEVIYGLWYADNWRKYIREKLGYFNFILLNRAIISIKYIDLIREHKPPQAKILYYPHDLSFVRVEREYRFTGDKRWLREANRLRSLEYKLIQGSDVILLPSEEEANIIREIFPEKSTITVPPFIYDEEFPISKNDNFDSREGILFVGGFRHRPNYHAVMWFLNEVWGKVKREIPEVSFYIVGSAAPKKIREIGRRDERVKVLGFVSEEELKEIYDRVRVVIAPLTYGAGVKGKVVEAIAYGVPLVSTSIGAEGIKEASDIMLIADSPEDFAKEVIRLYEDRKLWEKLRSRYPKYSKRYLSYERAKKLFKEILKG